MARGVPSIAPPNGSVIDRRTSVSSQVHEMIRQDIVRATLAPGMPLSEHALSQRFGVSRTPIREALLRLADEGLVLIIPQVGTYVTRISLAKVYEAQFIREALECAAARAAASPLSGADVSALDAIMTEQRRSLAIGDYVAFYAADEALHACIAASSGFPRVWTVASAEKLQLDRVRMLDVSQRSNMDVLVAQHQTIVEAIRSRDPSAAEDAIRAHLHDVFQQLRPLMAAYGAYFEDAGAEPPVALVS